MINHTDRNIPIIIDVKNLESIDSWTLLEYISFLSTEDYVNLGIFKELSEKEIEDIIAYVEDK